MSLPRMMIDAQTIEDRAARSYAPPWPMTMGEAREVFLRVSGRTSDRCLNLFLWETLPYMADRRDWERFVSEWDFLSAQLTDPEPLCWIRILTGATLRLFVPRLHQELCADRELLTGRIIRRSYSEWRREMTMRYNAVIRAADDPSRARDLLRRGFRAMWEMPEPQRLLSHREDCQCVEAAFPATEPVSAGCDADGISYDVDDIRAAAGDGRLLRSRYLTHWLSWWRNEEESRSWIAAQVQTREGSLAVLRAVAERLDDYCLEGLIARSHFRCPRFTHGLFAEEALAEAALELRAREAYSIHEWSLFEPWLEELEAHRFITDNRRS